MAIQKLFYNINVGSDTLCRGNLYNKQDFNFPFNLVCVFVMAFYVLAVTGRVSTDLMLCPKKSSDCFLGSVLLSCSRGRV